MKTEDLIVRLASEATPVTRLRSPFLRMVTWIAVALAAVVLGVVAFGIRRNIGAALHAPAFLADTAFAVSLVVFGGWASLVLAVPGAAEQSALPRLAMVTLLAWATLVIGSVIHDGRALGDSHWPVCALRVLLIGAVPAIMLVAMVRRAAPLYPASTGALTLAASAAAGTLAVQTICPISAAAHTILGHVGPILVLGVIGSLAGRAIVGRPSPEF